MVFWDIEPSGNKGNPLYLQGTVLHCVFYIKKPKPGTCIIQSQRTRTRDVALNSADLNFGDWCVSHQEDVNGESAVRLTIKCCRTWCYSGFCAKWSQYFGCSEKKIEDFQSNELKKKKKKKKTVLQIYMNSLQD